MKILINLAICLALFCGCAFAGTNSLDIERKTLSHISETNIKPIGLCFWFKMTWHGPTFPVTLMLDEYQPDLIVSVFNTDKTDPFLETRNLVDPEASLIGNEAVKSVFHNELTNGSETTTPSINANSSFITKTAVVVGSPHLFIPGLNRFLLRRDTKTLYPYFQSNLDGVPGRSGLAESLEVLNTVNLLKNYIGNPLDYWASEYPRDMSVDNNNDFKASASIAMHAADIVTQKNAMHVVKSTNNSCGVHCYVATVSNNMKDHEKWEEVWPNDRFFEPGKSDAHSLSELGSDDYRAGGGNYVFLIWRHYRGCIQSDGSSFITSVGEDVEPWKKK